MTVDRDDFVGLLGRVKELLRSEGRVSYRRLRRQFNLNDGDLADIRDELIHAQRIATDENNIVLVLRDTRTESPEASLQDHVLSPYTPRFTEVAFNSSAAPMGQRKLVTVLFCDVVDSMGLAERLGPESWHEIMAQFFIKLTEVVHGLEGSVNQYTGDGVMALFGVPRVHEDDGVRACLAALRIRETATQIADQVREKHRIELRIRIGINTGEVVVASIGDKLRMDYTAHGQVVGIASRLENMAAPNSILMSEKCRRQVAGFCKVRSMGAHAVKGVSTPIEIFELIAMASDADRFQAFRIRGLARFVGRDRELLELDTALADVRAGSGLIIGIEGDAGIGKSRLCHEFQEICRGRAISVFQGYTSAHRMHIPYLAMQRVFRAYFNIAEDEAVDSARIKIGERLSGIDLEFSTLVPLVFELLGIHDPDAPAPAIDPDAKQRQLLDLLRRVVQRPNSVDHSFVSLIEDLHWIDPASQIFLDEWVDALRSSHDLLIVSFRPGYRAEWMRSPHYRQMTLQPLPPEAISELLQDLLGSDPSTQGLVASIFARTGGNPFFCEEIVRSLRESGHLSSSSKSLVLRGQLTELEIPASVQLVLTARIDRLESSERTLLQMASVIGREFSSEVLRVASGFPATAVSHDLETLKRNGFLFETPESVANNFCFKHALTQEVTLHSQLKVQTRETHARIADALTTLYPDKQDEMAAVVAYHLEHAGSNLSAAVAYARAAAHIRAGNRLQQMEYIQKVLLLTQDLAIDGTRQQLRLQGLVEIIAGGAWRFSMSDAQLEVLCTEARNLAESAGLQELSLMIQAGRSAASGMMAGDARKWLSSIEALAGKSQGTSEEVTGVILGQYSYALYVSGQMVRGLELARQCEAFCKGDVQFGLTMGYCLLGAMTNCVALNQIGLGQLHEGFSTHRRGIEVLSEAGINEECIWNLANQIEGIVPRGLAPDHPDVMEATRNSFLAHDRAEQVASDFTRGVAKRCRIAAFLALHKFSDAESAALDCLQHLRDRRAHLEAEARCLTFLSEAQLAQGKVGHAIASAREAVSRSREQGAEYYESCALLILAKALVAASEPEFVIEAVDCLDRALSMTDRIGARAIHPQVLEQMAFLPNCAPVAAAQLLRSAVDAYRSAGIDGHELRLREQLGQQSSLSTQAIAKSQVSPGA